LRASKLPKGRSECLGSKFLTASDIADDDDIGLLRIADQYRADRPSGKQSTCVCEF
jgi:hypothetical protein